MYNHMKKTRHVTYIRVAACIEPFVKNMSNMQNNDAHYIGHVTDICDNIVSVTCLQRAFCGELLRFAGATGSLTGFV